MNITVEVPGAFLLSIYEIAQKHRYELEKLYEDAIKRDLGASVIANREKAAQHMLDIEKSALALATLLKEQEVPDIKHPDLVRALAKPGAAILQSLTAEKCHLLHMAYCILPEIGELAESAVRADVIEEMGDIEFYLEGLRQGLGMEREEGIGGPFAVEPSGWNTSYHALVVAAAIVVDAVKRHIFYEKAIVFADISHKLRTLEFHLACTRALHCVTREEIVAANITKLRARYEAVNGTLSYSNTAAVQRADKGAVPDGVPVWQPKP